MKKFSEVSLIERISQSIQIHNKSLIKGIGDDTAVVKIGNKKYALYTCDSLVSGVHFLETHSSPYDIGRKAAAVNLSDIAAMGGKPKYLLVSLFLPKGTTEKFIDELYRGLIDECKTCNVDIVGGNISKNNKFIIDIFLIGEVAPKNLLLRSGARVGDTVVVTGTLGDSATGLELLQDPQTKISGAGKKYFISRHLTPTSRIKEGMILAESGMITSMIDLSDGLSSDVGHICDESNVGVKLFLEKLPVSDGIEKITALNGGEDYELCFTTSFKNVSHLSQLLKKKTGTNIAIVGEIIPSKKGRWLIDGQGKKTRLISKGFDHFS